MSMECTQVTEQRVKGEGKGSPLDKGVRGETPQELRFEHRPDYQKAPAM